MAAASQVQRTEHIRNAYNYVKQDHKKTRQSASPKKLKNTPSKVA